MKKFKRFFVFALWGTMLTANPIGVHANPIVHKVVIAEVVNNNASGIANADLTATLNDGTVLGFRTIYNNSAYFCGAISQQDKLTIPDSIFHSSKHYAITNFYNNCDFSKAQSVKSLTLPATMESASGLPATIDILHLNSYINSVSSSDLSHLTKVLVPEEHLTSYFRNSSWSNYVLINAEGKEPSKITIKMTQPGEFAQLLLQQTDDWYKVNELTVVGNLNTNDLNVFKRMKQLTRLDLSKAKFPDIPDRFGYEYNGSSDRSGFNILTELILPEVNNIGDEAFAYCHRLQKIVMPKIQTIGATTFRSVGATQITLPEGLVSIGENAFAASKLESVTLPSSITEISDYCFNECANLKSAKIPASVTKIGYRAFHNTGLTSIQLPGVKEIQDYAFESCKKLAKVEFSEGLQTVGSGAFKNCNSLTTIDLPSTFQKLGSKVFGYCHNIKKITSRAVVPPIHSYNNDDILYGCDKTDIKLYVPAMSIDKYRAANGWIEFYTILPLEEKTSNLNIYDDATINDGTEFTEDSHVTLGWLDNNLCGAVDYNGNTTLSMIQYAQHHDMGDSYPDPYRGRGIFTSLIANGTMRADHVQTTLKTPGTRIWYFFSLPYDVKIADIAYTDGTQFAIRKYSGKNRAALNGNTWINLTENDILKAYEGYILKCNKENAEFTFPALNNANKNKVFEKGSVEMPLEEHLSEFEHNRSWNLIGNPYPCYYDTRQMDFTAPITVWNRYNNRYDAYSPIDDAYILHPAQAFFVQRPVNKGTLVFDKAGRQKNGIAQDLEPKAKVNHVEGSLARKIYNIMLSDGTTQDRARFVINNTASCAYELDKDASKFITEDNKAMLIYTIEHEVKYAINERPMTEGYVDLGFYAPAAGEYTLSLQTLQKDNIILIDHENHTRTALADGYHFKAPAGYNNSRFSLLFDEATGIDAMENHATNIVVENGVVFANSAYQVYTIDGRLVGKYAGGSNAVLAKGVYVISCHDVKRKIVVK